MPAFQFRFALCCFGLLFQFALVVQKVRERTRTGSQRTFSLMRGRSCNAKLLKQDLLRMNDTSSLGDTIRKQGQFGSAGSFPRHPVAADCASLPHGFYRSVSTLWLPHQKILEDQIPSAAVEWSAATTALYLAVNRFGSRFDFDHAIERVAVRAMERGWPVRSRTSLSAPSPTPAQRTSHRVPPASINGIARHVL
jgi:hypothetical protein